MTTRADRTPPDDPYRLPDVLSLEARRVRYPEPRIYFVGQEQRSVTQAVEILVRTSHELPAVAVSPVLFVGETPIRAYRPEGDEDLYRFYVYEPERLVEGSPVSIGWPNDPAHKVPTRFQYRPGPAVS